MALRATPMGEKDLAAGPVSSEMMIEGKFGGVPTPPNFPSSMRPAIMRPSRRSPWGAEGREIST